MLTENFFRLVIGTYVSVIVARYLGPENLGTLSYAISFTAIIAPFAGMGFDSILFRNLIKYKLQAQKQLNTAQFLRMISSSVIILLLVIILFQTRGLGDKTSILILILSLSFFIDSFLGIKEYFAANQKFIYIATSGIIALLIASVYRVFLVSYESNLFLFAFAIPFQKIIFILILFMIFLKENKKKGGYNNIISKSLINDSWPLIFSSFSGILYMYQDQILIEYFYGFNDVGIYVIGCKLVMIFMSVPTILSNIIYPEIIKNEKKLSWGNFENYLIKVYFSYIVIASIFIAISIVFGSKIIYILYGDDYQKAYPILSTYAFSLIPAAHTTLSNKLLMINNNQNFILMRNIIGLIVNLILNVILLPSIGIIGAAIATVVTQTGISISFILNPKTRYIAIIQLKAFLYPFIYAFRRILK